MIRIQRREGRSLVAPHPRRSDLGTYRIVEVERQHHPSCTNGSLELILVVLFACIGQNWR